MVRLINFRKRSCFVQVAVFIQNYGTLVQTGVTVQLVTVPSW